MAPHSKGEKDVYDVNYYYIEGQKLFKLQRYEEALAACEAAIRLKPDNVWSYYNKSLAFHCLGRHEEAVQALEQAASLSSDAHFLLTAYSQQGKTLLNHHQHKQALAVYEQAVRLDSRYAPGIFPQPAHMFERQAAA